MRVLQMFSQLKRLAR